MRRARDFASRVFLRLSLRPSTHGGDLVRLGTDYGGWWVPRGLAAPGTVAYCAGAGEDVSLDIALHDAGCEVTVFDPTPRAIAYVERHAPTGPRFRFVPIGWWDEETELRFFAPRDPAHVSHSVVNLQATSEYFMAQVKPVDVLMRDLGDDHVDLIKMDIEGAEYAVIDSLLERGPQPIALCVEFDQPEPIVRTIRAVRKLREAGYALVKIERWNYTFVRSPTDSVRRALTVAFAVPDASRAGAIARRVVRMQKSSRVGPC